MNITYRHGTKNDLSKLKGLAINTWAQFEPKLTVENWKKLFSNLSNDNTYAALLDMSTCFVASTDDNDIVGMAFLVSKGNPTDIYDKDWCYIRFVTVAPAFGEKGIGRKLTNLCIETAKQNNETVIALHTSELMNAARHIYESMGFKIAKEIDQRLGMRYWLYKLELDKPNA